MAFDTPDCGFIFWPVGTGDSTTIVINDETFMQVDLRHMAKSEGDDDPAYPVVDELEKILPTINNTPYLSTFVLTHPDLDHIQGFSDLLERVTIGELWFTPRIFREYKKDLCDNAIAFKEEAERRLKAVIDNNGNVESGDRIRIIGYDDLLEEDEFSGLPDNLLTIPGNFVTNIDGVNVDTDFSAFIHAPFKPEEDEERNDTSLGMQVTVIGNKSSASALLLGDLKYSSIRKIIDASKQNGNQNELQWNILLAPHHCSKSVMFVKNEDTEEYEYQSDIMEDLEESALDPGYIISSSMPVPDSNEQGDNPPHAIAKEKYELIAPNDFICTHENPEEDTNPVVFDVECTDLIPTDDDTASEAKGLGAAIESARGQSEPPSSKAGFGSK